MVNVDSETLFNAAAAVVTTIAVLFFTFNVEFPYSPVSKVLLVLVLLAGVFAITQAATDQQLTILGYGVIVTSVIGLFFHVVGTFDAGDAVTVFGLLVIAAILFVLRTRFDESNYLVSSDTAKKIFAVVAAIAVVVIAVDVATGGLVYELQPHSEVEYPGEDRDPAVIGVVVVRNPTPLPEEVDTPNYQVCTAGNWSQYRPGSDRDEPEDAVRADVHVEDGYNEHVLGYGVKRYPLRLHVRGTNLQGESFPVQTTSECPDDEAGSPYIALFERSDGDRYGPDLTVSA